MSVAAFLGIAERGPLYVARRLTNFTQFRELYGGFVPYAYLAHAVFGFFANGGRECYVIRIGHVTDDEAQTEAAGIELPAISTAAPSEFPAPSSDGRRSGRDRLETLTTDDFVGFSEGPGARRALAALDEIDEIGLVALPDLMMMPDLSSSFREAEIFAVQSAVVAHCERRRDRFAILDPPPGCGPEQVREWRRRFDSKYAALYYPWVKVPVPNARGSAVRAVPPSGHIAGVYARCDREQGIHKAPANEVLE